MTTKIQLGTIEEEAQACRKAFEGIQVGAWALHCHHGEPLEKLSQPPENRINYIVGFKPILEVALRLRLFRPLPKEKGDTYIAGLRALNNDYSNKINILQSKFFLGTTTLEKDYYSFVDSLFKTYDTNSAILHSQYCISGCPWDGYTIFPESINPTIA